MNSIIKMPISFCLLVFLVFSSCFAASASDCKNLMDVAEWYPFEAVRDIHIITYKQDPEGVTQVIHVADGTLTQTVDKKITYRKSADGELFDNGVIQTSRERLTIVKGGDDRDEIQSEGVFAVKVEGENILRSPLDEEMQSPLNYQVHFTLPEDNKVWMDEEGEVYRWKRVKNIPLPAPDRASIVTLPEAYLLLQSRVAEYGDREETRNISAEPPRYGGVDILWVYVRHHGLLFYESKLPNQTQRVWRGWSQYMQSQN